LRKQLVKIGRIEIFEREQAKIVAHIQRCHNTCPLASAWWPSGVNRRR